MHRFKNNMAQLFNWNNSSGRLKDKVKLEGQMRKWS